MKKGIAITQLFIYTVSAAVFLLILTFGFKFAIDFVANQEIIQQIEFKSSLNRDVQRYMGNRGSATIATFRIPGKFHTLCIADSAGGSAQALDAEYPQFYRAWRTGSENIFLIPKQDVSLYLPNIEIPGGYFCTDIRGGVTLRIEGEGRTVSIEPR